jgi:hypothetical protein
MMMMIHGEHPPLQPELFELRARADDPTSSHEAAARDFDIKPSGLALRRQILDALAWADGEWLTCRDLIEIIYGPEPYTYAEAVALNKVQTVALGLWRSGMIERHDPGNGERLQYRRMP